MVPTVPGSLGFQFQKLLTAVYDVRALWLSLTSALFKFHRTEFHHLELQFHTLSSSTEPSSTIQDFGSTKVSSIFQFHCLGPGVLQFEFHRIWFHQQVFNQSSSTELSSCIFNIEIQVPRNSTEFRHLIIE